MELRAANAPVPSKHSTSVRARSANGSSGSGIQLRGPLRLALMEGLFGRNGKPEL